MPDFPTETQPERRNWIWSVIQIVLRLIFALWLRYRARGHELITHRGGMLLIINHQSFLDPLLVGLPLRRPVSFLARDNLFRVPFIGWVLRNTYVLPINRESAGTAALREMVARLKAGFWVGIFPEGTRSIDGSLGEIKPGFVAMLRRANVPVCPVGIAGADRALGRNHKLPHFSTIRVVFGELIPPEQIAETLKQSETALLELIRSRLQSCLTEANHWRDHRSAVPNTGR
jgi:1-acyl-sn-glycerol-3-phosphate acyltransferase